MLILCEKQNVRNEFFSINKYLFVIINLNFKLLARRNKAREAHMILLVGINNRFLLYIN